jgi:hypothetical protein
MENKKPDLTLKLNDIIKKINNLNWIMKDTTTEEIIKPLDDIFYNKNLTNIFLNDITLSKLLLNYVSTVKLNLYYEIFDYLVDKFKDDKDIIKMFNTLKFNNGLFTDMKIKFDNEQFKNILDEQQLKMINTVLILNNQPTTNNKFNEILKSVLYLNINDFKFKDIINDVLLNNIQNNYNFNFMNKYEKPKEEINKSINNVKQQNIKTETQNFKFTNLNIIDNYILKYNDNSKVFKMWFYMLLSYVFDKDLSFEQLLNIFLNANIIFYNKLINLNDSSDNLITYIYFKNDDNHKEVLNDENYIPNLRYTIDIKGDNTNDKIQYLKNNSEKPINKFSEFDTNIVFDDKGIYFKTCNYKQDEIINVMKSFVRDEKYDDLLYYIFNSQFLNRSTCLFGYYIYYYYTKRILKNNYYYDIIGLTRPFEEFKEIIKNRNNSIVFLDFEHIQTLNLNDIINNIK